MSTGSLVLSFPLRPNYLAQIVVPRDLTTREAERLRKFIESLAVNRTVANDHFDGAQEGVGEK